MNSKLFLEKNIPDLNMQSIVQKQGNEHSVIEVNNTWIFRFAKSPDVQQHMGIEVQLLKKLEGKITCSIPKVAYYFPDAFCFGYQKISGVPFTYTIYTQLTAIQKKQFAVDFAQFLYELHTSLTIDITQNIGLSRADWPLSPEILKKRFPASADKHLQEIFDLFIAKYQLIVHDGKKLVLVHNDLHTANILIDQTTKKLSGIIDFTSAAIDNMYHEFRYLHLIDMELVLLAVQAYNQKSGENLAVHNAYIYCMATEFSRLTEALEKNGLAKATEIKDRIYELNERL